MSAQRFQNHFEDLPPALPVFPLSGVLLLPGGLLPLNVFEPRYLAMVEDALGCGRLIGMIQPVSPEEENEKSETPPRLYETGCAGRISHFSETEDGRFLITLTGISRFRIVEEIAARRGYRRAAVSWSSFRNDFDGEEEPAIDRPRLIAALKAYGRLHGMDINWKAVETASDRALSISLPMACPFEPSEKQALLECPDITQRAHTLLTLMEMAIADGGARQNLVRQ
ncbi:MAG: LON peptidase substrate-binding domain-containing protein [Rhodospirillaceae bacterium]|nr:LON peptidase substrate-binding domain-containing protein [Rhodospirillaceae bacterium]MEA4836993.1 LON peptidase substrate-binding domain-containing protein [Rhodospirillaceae bacterium]